MLIAIKPNKFDEILCEANILKDALLLDLISNELVLSYQYIETIREVCQDVHMLLESLNRFLIDEKHNTHLKIDEYMCIVKTEDIDRLQTYMNRMKNILNDLKVKI